jgi:hypothetical protein
MEITLDLVGLIVPFVIFLALLGICVYQYITKGKISEELTDTVAELGKALAQKSGILAFFDLGKSISETDYETIINEIPANTWRMSDRNRNLILDSCTDEERLDIDSLIDSYEVSSTYGDVQKEYHITTHGMNGGIWRVEFGIPTLITPSNKMYNYLSDEQKVDICKHVTDPITVLNEISANERELTVGYTIVCNETIIDVYDGDVTITKA